MKIERLPRNYTLLTDEYEFTMSETYLKMERKMRLLYLMFSLEKFQQMVVML